MIVLTIYTQLFGHNPTTISSIGNLILRVPQDFKKNLKKCFLDTAYIVMYLED